MQREHLVDLSLDRRDPHRLHHPWIDWFIHRAVPRRGSTSPKSTGVVIARNVMEIVRGPSIQNACGSIKRAADFGEIGLRRSTSPKSTGVVIARK